MQVFMSMSPAVGPAWHVIEIINSADVKRYMYHSFDKRKVPPWVSDFWQVEDFTLRKRHGDTIMAGISPVNPRQTVMETS
jgi:hypothetical protein